MSISACALPAQALLQRYRRAGAYTDCYKTELDFAVSHSQFVAAFYTTRLFKLERLILHLAVRRGSSDQQALALARAQREQFAAWFVEARAEHQLLLSDYRQQTRSWLMTQPAEPGTGTLLYFGSAVVDKRIENGQSQGMGLLFRALLGFHKLYSVALLQAARRRLIRQHSTSESHAL